MDFKTSRNLALATLASNLLDIKANKVLSAVSGWGTLLIVDMAKPPARSK
jgi:hypothetical protein